MKEGGTVRLDRKNTTWLGWSTAVVATLQAAGRIRNRGTDDSAEYLDRCRGDEPRMEYDAGQSVDEYVNWIMNPGPFTHKLADGTPCTDDGDTGYLDPEIEL